jgi:hypothetical protein
MILGFINFAGTPKFKNSERFFIIKMAGLNQGIVLLKELSNGKKEYFLDPDPLVDSIRANRQHPATYLNNQYEIRFLPFHYSFGKQGILLAVAASECTHALRAKSRSTILSLISDVSVRSIEDMLKHSYHDTKTPAVLGQAYFIASGNEAEMAFSMIMSQAIHFSTGYRRQQISTAGGLAQLIDNYRTRKGPQDD